MLALEQLESRLVPSLTALPLVLANPGNPATGTDPNPDEETSYAPPNVAVAENAAGSFVEVWFSASNDNEILAQRFNKYGDPLGGQITVIENYSPETQNPVPAVGMDSAGDFVVAFDSSSGIFASRFNAAGKTLDKTPFQVDAGSNTFEDSNPSVALDNRGRFDISWVGFSSGGAGVYVQEGLDSGATALAGGTQTVAFESFSSFVFFQSASVSADAKGNFVVAYEGVSFFSNSSSSVYAQRYGPTASPLGSAITLSTSGVASAPAVAVNRTSGDFAVTWVEATSSPVLKAQTFRSTGVALSAPFAINPIGGPPSSQAYDTPSVAADAAGGFVAAWAVHGGSDEQVIGPNERPNGSEPTGSVYARTFNTAGKLTGGTITVSTQPNAPGPTAVGMNAAGDFVVGFSASRETVDTKAGPSATGNSYDIDAAVFGSVILPGRLP